MNALTEFLDHVDGRHVRYVQISRRDTYLHSRLIEGPYNTVLPQLNFDYDSGFGGQILSGTIWYSDGTWSTRCEYDGSEWWEHRECPPLPTNADI